MGYFRQALKGVSWVGAFRGFTRIIAFAKIAILARILLPEQFGLFGIATLFLAFLEILVETGINVFLIQEKKAIDKYINTAWTVSIIRGIIISLIIIISAPFVSSFFKSPQSLSLIYLISVVPLVRGFINPSIVKFQKELQFKREFWFRSSIFLFDASVAVIAALVIRSASSLILGLIAGAVLEVIMSFIFARPKAKLAIEVSRIKRIIGRGKWVTGAGIFQYAFRQGDDIIVGRLMGENSLGLYQVAYKISTLPISEVADVVSRVTFPVFSKIATDIKRIKIAFIKTILMVTAVVVPFGLIIFLFPTQLVTIILGVNWLEVVPALKILAIFGVLKAIQNSAYSVLLALEKQEYVTVITFASVLGLGISIIPLVNRYGIVGAGASAIIGTLVALPVAAYYLVKVLK